MARPAASSSPISGTLLSAGWQCADPWAVRDVVPVFSTT